MHQQFKSNKREIKPLCNDESIVGKGELKYYLFFQCLREYEFMLFSLMVLKVR